MRLSGPASASFRPRNCVFRAPSLTQLILHPLYSPGRQRLPSIHSRQRLIQELQRKATRMCVVRPGYKLLQQPLILGFQALVLRLKPSHPFHHPRTTQPSSVAGLSTTQRRLALHKCCANTLMLMKGLPCVAALQTESNGVDQCLPSQRNVTPSIKNPDNLLDCAVSEILAPPCTPLRRRQAHSPAPWRLRRS